MIAYTSLISGIFATDNASMRRPASEGAVPFQGAHGEEKVRLVALNKWSFMYCAIFFKDS